MVKRLGISALTCFLFASVAIGAVGCKPQEEVEKEIQAISASGMKQEFQVGDAFETGNITVTARYSDGTTSRLKENEYSVDGSSCDMFAEGNYSAYVTATNSDVAFSYQITVKEIPFDGEWLQVEGMQTSFVLGEEFQAEGLQAVLHGERTDESRLLSSGEYEIDSTRFDSSKEGTCEISVRMKQGGISARYFVTVRKDYSKSFKILAIGNSFSDDATQYLYDIAKAYGSEDVVIGNLYVGGCTLSQHKTFAQLNQAVYDYRKNTTGSFITTPQTRLLDAIRDEEWDVVTLQQASQESGQSATYNNDLAFMLNYIKTYGTNDDCKIGWHMTWAYQKDTTHWAYSLYESNQRVMYESIVNAVKTKIVTNEAFDYVFPVGTAIQNARTSTIGDTLTRDGYHLTLDTGRFIAGLTWYLTITGKSVDDLPVSAVPASTASVLNVVKESVAQSLAYPFSVSQSSYQGEYAFTPSDYTPYSLTLSQGYWSAKSGETIVSDAKNSTLFVASSLRFTKSDLPVGTVIVLKEGWRLRAEAWAETYSFPRPQNSLERILVVDESWWDGFTHRAFNLSKVTGEAATVEEAEDAVLVYLPKSVDYK